MNFKLGDKVCFSPDIFEKSKSELIEQYGTGVISSEEYTDTRLLLRPRLRLHLCPRLNDRPLFRPRPRLHLRPHYINITWEGIEGELWECVGYLCLVEERKERDIYALFEQEMKA